jgi:arylsulfatase A-like enzyme
VANRNRDRRWPYLLAAALAVAVYVWASLEIRSADSDLRPLGGPEDIARLSSRDDVNVLFVVIDTLRADRLGSYGYSRDTSPSLDRLAEGGVRFARHQAQSSWTKASMASLWSGLYPARAGVTRFQHRLAQEATLPAEILREAGFRTAGIWRNGWVSGYHGFDQGFEVYNRPVGRPPPASVLRENPTLSTVGTDVDAIAAAIQFLRVYGRERWLLYLHLMDVHEYVYDEDSALFGTDYTDVYDNSIRRVNLVLDELLEYLKREGFFENTLIVVTSDHGEAFGERGFEGHAREVYRETTEVPWILSFPFRLEPGVVVERRSRGVDLWPTLLDLLGLPAMRDTDGSSRVADVLAAARGQSPPEDGVASVAHLDQTWGRRNFAPQPTVAVSDGSFRYVVSREPDGTTREELFDAALDAREIRNVIRQRGEVASRLRSVAESYLGSEPPWGSDTPPLELDEMELNQLRALGYAVP